VPDLLAFIDGIRANHLISRDALRQMTVDHSGMPVRKKDFAHYGYGSFVPPHSPGLVFFSHGGDADGFASVLSVDFKRGVDVVALGNGGKRSEEILKSIIDAVREAYAESRQPASSVSRP
jgi:hypothetical protein